MENEELYRLAEQCAGYLGTIDEFVKAKGLDEITAKKLKEKMKDMYQTMED